MELTPNETTIIETIRWLNPYEKVEITKDGSGKPDYYLIHRSQKIVLINK